MFAEPKECLEDIAMAQWEEASVITVRGTVKSEGSTGHHPAYSLLISIWHSQHGFAAGAECQELLYSLSCLPQAARPSDIRLCYQHSCMAAPKRYFCIGRPATELWDGRTISSSDIRLEGKGHC